MNPPRGRCAWGTEWFSLLAFCCHCGNAAIWGCHHSLCSSEGTGQAAPTTLIPKKSSLGCEPYTADSAVLAPRCQAAPVCSCNGRLCPSPPAGRGSSPACPGLAFLQRKWSLLPSVPALGSAGREAFMPHCFAVHWSWLGAGGTLSPIGLVAAGPQPAPRTVRVQTGVLPTVFCKQALGRGRREDCSPSAGCSWPTAQ